MTVPTPALVDADRWLTDVMGTSVFRVHTDACLERPSSSALALREHAAAQGAAMYYVKVPTTRVDAVQALGTAGFSVIDTAVTFDLAVAVPRPSPPGIAVGTVTGDQAEAVLEVAGSAFRYSRFHLDPRVPLELAHHVKREWIRSYVLGRRGDRLLVATLDGRPAGFLAALVTGSAEARTCVVDLVGVANWAQRRGVATALVQAFIDAYRGAAVLRVGTQVANVPSIRLYERLGFLLVASHYVLHLHVGPMPGRPAA